MVDGEPRHSVDSRLITVDKLAAFFAASPPAPGVIAPLVPGVENDAPGAGPEAACSRRSRSSTNPLAASGAGSMLLRV